MFLSVKKKGFLIPSTKFENMISLWRDIISPETSQKYKELAKFEKPLLKMHRIVISKTWNGLRRSGTTVESLNSLSNPSIEFASSSTSLRNKQGVYCPWILSHFVSASAWSSGRGPARVETTRHRRSLDMFTIFLDKTVLRRSVLETSGGNPLRKG